MIIVKERGALEVHYDDTRWKSIDYSAYWFCSREVTCEHFPIGGTGTRSVQFVHLHFGQEVTLSLAHRVIINRGLRAPDRAEAETYFDKHPEERNQFPTVAICGNRYTSGIQTLIPFIDSGPKGRGVCRYVLHNPHWWNDPSVPLALDEGRTFLPNCRFLAVKK